MHEVQYMLKMKHKRALSRSAQHIDLVHLMQSLNVSHAVCSIGISKHNFGTKKDARCAKCVHLQHETMTNVVHIEATKQCTPVH